jgi:hypothetical protein
MSYTPLKTVKDDALSRHYWQLLDTAAEFGDQGLIKIPLYVGMRAEVKRWGLDARFGRFMTEQIWKDVNV